MRYMKTFFKPRPNGGGAEQDLISEFFGHYCPQCKDWAGTTLQCRSCKKLYKDEELNSINDLPVMYNMQTHQIPITGMQAKEFSQWHERMVRMDSNDIVHYSAWPKPMSLLMGTVSHGKESAWSCAGDVEDHQYFNDPDESLSDRADYFADRCFAHHWDRIAKKQNTQVDSPKKALGQKSLREAIHMYINDFFDKAWPHWLVEVWTQMHAMF